MDTIQGRKLIILGDESGVSNRVIENAFAGSGAEVIYSATECFV